MKGRAPEMSSWRRLEIWYLPAEGERSLVALVQTLAGTWYALDVKSSDPLFESGTYAGAKLFVLQQGYVRVEGRIQLARRGSR